LARSNSGDGIHLFTGGSTTACTAIFNGGSGISLTEGGSAIGCTSNSNSADGIRVTSACYVARCNADSNSLAGVRVAQGGSDNRIEGNKVTNNNASGIKVDGTVNLIYGNTARGNTSNGIGSNYSIDSGNRVGTIVVPTVSGTVTNNSGATGFGLNDPWANIAY
jgi:parallel beta-helix repeat protein